ncbi:hypothetical protein [Adhaeribacter pallidiroseus]|uniref:Uncharacterized protein n=1 Tax=Adhaeribacter pallidiroseus TaxID=2072847 RepID=A0A369QEG9_9BACT|nr:hypothetical protein [Adhaeribacter pallidiroseus]RDC61637.1 hypothetical protein AHMF7616_00217 [Adhaeribacter pallidiroseus]
MENNTNNLNQPADNANNILDTASSYFKNLNLNQVPDQLKQFGTTAANKVKGLSTTQKVIGGALLVLGAGYLSRRSRLNFRNVAHNLKQY